MGGGQSKTDDCNNNCISFPLSLIQAPEKRDILESVAPELLAKAQNLHADTGGDAQLRQAAMENVAKLKSKLKYGVLRCDYEYKPTRGDPGDPSSFLSTATEIKKVEGWTFEAVQRGISDKGTYPASEFRIKKADGSTDAYWNKLWNAFPDEHGSGSNRSGYRRVTTKPKGDKYSEGYFDPEDYTKGEVYRYDPDVIEANMKKTVQSLEKSNVCGITADVGYSQAFQQNVTQMVSVPVVLSSLQQLTFVSAFFDFTNNNANNKIMVMTANANSFDMDKLIPPSIDKSTIKLVGMESATFGKWVAGGNSFSRFKKDAFDDASVEEAMESMADECGKAIAEVEREGGEVVCIVLECGEMPAYTNGLRRRFNLPVFDTFTAIQYVQLGTGPGSHAAYMM